MFYISINTEEIVKPFTTDIETIRNITQTVVEGVSWALYNEIRNNANKTLKKTRGVYLRNLQQPNIGPLSGTITLTGALPNMIEQGATAYDMKQGFLNSKKAKIGKNGGKYLTIPFRWATAGSLGENEAFSGVMPTEIQALVKNLKSGRTQFAEPQSVSGEGLKLPTTSTFGKVLTRKAFSDIKSKKTFGSYTHKAPIHQGIIKQTSAYENAFQSQYMSFRRISLNSDKNSWIHPGLTAKEFFEKSMESLQIDTVVSNIVDRELEIIGL